MAGAYKESEEEWLEKIKATNVKYIVVDDEVKSPEKMRFQTFIRNKELFKPVYRIAIDTNVDKGSNFSRRGRLTVYEFLDSKPFKKKKVRIPIPVLASEVEVKLGEPLR